MPFGAVFALRESYGAMRYGFLSFKIMRCGAVPFFSFTVRCLADDIPQESYGAVRCGYPLNNCFLRCG